MSYERKTRPGPPFSDMGEFVEWVEKRYWVWWGRPVHPGWAWGWQLLMVSGLIKSGTLHKCLCSDSGDPYRTGEE